MENKELVINKRKDLLNIKNKDSYTKLTLNCEVNPILLKGFNNIKELTLKLDTPDDNHLNEMTLNKLPFISTLERLNLINIDEIGKKEKGKPKSFDRYDFYQPSFNNLKYFSFTSDSSVIYTNNEYLKNAKNLEEIEVNISDEFRISGDFNIYSSLKRIIINIFDDTYIFNLDYIPFRIDKLTYSIDDKMFYLEYYNNLIRTGIYINVITDEIEKINKLTRITDELIKDNTLYIPDCVTHIDFYTKNYMNKINHISFNIDLLKNIIYKTSITDNNYLKIIKSIELRKNNEMSLYPNTIININDYGIINELYIIDNKLHIVFDALELIVDDKGIVYQEEKQEEVKEEINEEKIEQPNILDNYSISELESYLQYRKLLETFKDSNDSELDNAINIIGNKLIKKLTK